PPEPPPDAPPANAVIDESSVARNATAPPAFTTEPFVIDASMVLPMPLPVAEPAAAICTPPMAQPEPPAAKPIAEATMVACDTASSVTAPVVVTDDASIDARIVFVMEFVATDAPAWPVTPPTAPPAPEPAAVPAAAT